MGQRRIQKTTTQFGQSRCRQGLQKHSARNGVIQKIKHVHVERLLSFDVQQSKDQNNKFNGAKNDQDCNATVLRFLNVETEQEQDSVHDHYTEIEKRQISPQQKMQEQHGREDQGCRCDRKSGINLCTAFIAILILFLHHVKICQTDHRCQNIKNSDEGQDICSRLLVVT